MAAKQSMKPRATAKKITATSKKSVATKATETVKTAALKAAKTPAPRKTKATTLKTAKTPVPRKTKAADIKASSITKTPRSKAGSNKAPAPKSNQEQDLLQQAIQTQAWMTNEITQLRQQLAKANQSATSSPQNSEIERLQQENAELREKASRLDQMTFLLQGQAPATRANKAVKKTSQKTTPKVSTPKKTRVPKAAPVAKVSTKSASPAPTARKTRSGVSILQDAAAKDVNRTYKSCWPIVFKIEEWNQKHPGQLAKVSQTMLNKSGVNFSRAKGFMDNYGDLVESYHQQIGLSKANSGKFNEVYEFIRSALGKGKKV